MNFHIHYSMHWLMFTAYGTALYNDCRMWFEIVCNYSFIYPLFPSRLHGMSTCSLSQPATSHSGWSFVALNLTSKIINAGEHIHAYEMEIVGKWKPTCLNINNLLFPLHKTFKLNILCISIINGAGLRSNKCDSVVWAFARFWHKQTCICRTEFWLALSANMNTTFRDD